MKKFLLPAFAGLSLICSTSCKTDFDQDVADSAPQAGTANFSKYVALGNSLTSGYRDGALYMTGQKESYPVMLSEQMKAVGGGEFLVPYMADELGGIKQAGIVDKLQLKVVNGSLSPVGNATIEGNTTLASIFQAGKYFQNMGVPGAKSYHLVANGYGSLAGLSTGTANPYFVRFASSPTTSVVADAKAQNPTFFSLWIGNNDVLGYATAGGDELIDKITPTATFTAAYNAILSNMTQGGTKGVIANIPDVTSIPFFTRVPYNPVPAERLNTAPAGSPSNADANLASINQILGAVKQILSASGDGARIQLLSKTSNNPVLLLDESLTDRSANITAGLTASGAFPAQTAAFIGQVFGRARHATPADLIPLRTSAVIGTAPTGVPAPFNSYGITYPLDDKHVLRGIFGTGTDSEVALVQKAVADFNAIIAAKASEYNLAFVDANSRMSELGSMSGILYDGVRYTSTFVTGGTFSLDGVHLTGRGYALMANEFIIAINKKYGSTLRQVEVNRYSGVTFPQ